MRWWRARDVEALPYFYFGKDEGALGAPLRIQEVVFRNANRSPQLRARLGQVAEHTLSPYDVFPAATVLRWTLGAALKGSPSLLLEFLTMGKRGAIVARELKVRRALLQYATTAD